MIGPTEAMLAAAAAWIAAATAVYLACSLLATRRAAMAVAAVVIAIGATTGEVASADSPHPQPPAGPPLTWTAPDHLRRDIVVVSPGDCLWAITARELRDPTAARIAERWPRWWQVNHKVIGPNPNLIQPGQRLHAPDPMPRRH